MSKPRYGFSRDLRLRRQVDFDRVYRNNVYAADQTLVVQARRNDHGKSRLGLAVSRRVGNAVVRNRWKRLIRESFRRCQHHLPIGIDLVVRPRRGARSDFQEILRSLPRLVARVEKRLRTG